jgi:hypothetical protein
MADQARRNRRGFSLHRRHDEMMMTSIVGGGAVIHPVLIMLKG